MILHKKTGGVNRILNFILPWYPVAGCPEESRRHKITIALDVTIKKMPVPEIVSSIGGGANPARPPGMR